MQLGSMAVYAAGFAAAASIAVAACSDDERAHWPPPSGANTNGTNSNTSSNTSSSTSSTSAAGGGGAGGTGGSAGAPAGGGGAGGLGFGGGGGAGGAAFQLLPGVLVPDFILADANPNSTTFGQPVSPRQFLMRVSGWYFGHST